MFAMILVSIFDYRSMRLDKKRPGTGAGWVIPKEPQRSEGHEEAGYFVLREEGEAGENTPRSCWPLAGEAQPDRA
jgi:hypothetical protein